MSFNVVYNTLMPIIYGVIFGPLTINIVCVLLHNDDESSLNSEFIHPERFTVYFAGILIYLFNACYILLRIGYIQFVLYTIVFFISMKVALRAIERKAIVKSIEELLNTYGYDGIDSESIAPDIYRQISTFSKNIETKEELGAFFDELMNQYLDPNKTQR